MNLKLVCSLSIINEVHILWNINIKQSTKNADKLKFCFLSEGFSIKTFPRTGWKRLALHLLLQMPIQAMVAGIENNVIVPFWHR